MSPKTNVTSLTLIYDAECGFCDRLLRWLRQQDRHKSIEFLAYQTEECRRRYPAIGAAECAEGGKLILPDGTIVSGADAAPHLLRVLKGWSWAATILSIPAVLWIIRPIYRRIARNRIALSCKLRLKV